MAIVFRGGAQTSIRMGNDATTQNLFVIENGIASRININVKKLVVLSDVLAAYTADPMPLIKISRLSSAATGGLFVEKITFDTTLSSDAAVQLRAGNITASAGNIIWQSFGTRMHTTYGQINGWEGSLLPHTVDQSGKEFKVRPGEWILVHVASPTVTENAITLSNWFVEIEWEEDSITTFNISGTISLNGSPLVGAKIIVIESRNNSLTDPVLREVTTSTTGGAWSSTIRTGWIGGAFVQYESGGTLYTAAGSPFLEP